MLYLFIYLIQVEYYWMLYYWKEIFLLEIVINRRNQIKIKRNLIKKDIHHHNTIRFTSGHIKISYLLNKKQIW